MMMIHCRLKHAGISQGYNIISISTEEHSAFCWLSVENYYLIFTWNDCRNLCVCWHTNLVLPNKTQERYHSTHHGKCHISLNVTYKSLQKWKCNGHTLRNNSSATQKTALSWNSQGQCWRRRLRRSWRTIQDENCTLLGYYATSNDNSLQTFLDYLLVPSSWVKNPRMKPVALVSSSYMKGCRGRSVVTQYSGKD
jgi:hypothetical protein